MKSLFDEKVSFNELDTMMTPPELELPSRKGKGSNFEIPAEGYTFDLVVLYDDSMLTRFGDINATETR